MDTLIRRAQPGDEATLAELGARTFTETFGYIYAPEDLQAFLETSHSEAVYRGGLNDPAMAFWLAEKNGEAVGYASAGPCTLPVDNRPTSSGEVGRLYVAKGHQGGGLGVAMLEDVLTWLEAHFEHLYISVFSENTGAQRLYARYGFSKIKEYKYMVGNHADHEFLFARTKA